MKQLSYIILLFTSFFLLSCSNSKDKEVDAYGNFEAVETTISAQSGGQIIHLNLEEGQTFAQPQLVGYVDTTILCLQLKKLKTSYAALQAQITSSKAQINALKLELDLIQKKKKRILYMFKNKASTPQDRDDILTAEQVASQKITAAEASLQSLVARLDEIQASEALLKEQINHCRIDIPEPALVLEKYVEPYEYVLPGQSLFRITNPKEMILRVYVSERQLPEVKLGQEVKVFFDDLSAQKQAQVTGRISWIGDQAIFTPKTVETKEERVNLVFPMKIIIRNDGRPKLGMPAQVKF